LRVLLDTTYAARAPFSGTAIYLARLHDALGRLEGVDVVEACNRHRRAPAGGGLGSARNAMLDAWWTSAELPRLARRAGADVIHHPLPAIAMETRIPQLITVHDLAFERLPEAFDRGFRTYAHWAHRSAAQRSAAVICVSETTAADVRELWAVQADRIVVARHGPGQELPVAARAEVPAWLLYVGDAEPRKNLSALLEAYGLYRRGAGEPLGLVLAGAVPAAVDAGAGMRAERGVSPARLAELYAGAAALVHPSLYEGFGLTALEAMCAGTPVIAADAPGVREVCGDAALYCNPLDPASFAAAMASVGADPALRARLSERGRERSGEFSWDASARAHLDAYSLAVHG
jgi:glycosyltransferase involved in cell wall biosynthesis